MSEEKQLMAELPSLLRLARKEAGFSQSKMGEQVGVGQRTIGRWEKGKGAPDIYELSAIRVATEKTWQWFIPELENDPGKKNGVAESGTELLVRGDDYFEHTETGVLTIYDGAEMQVGAGPNGFGFEVFEDTAIDVRYYKQMMQDLLGFWAPDSMRAVRVAGHSMLPAIKPGQLLLYDPMDHVEGIVTRRRYVISLYNEKAEMWTPLAKQLVRRSTGGFRIVSENEAYGEPDTVLLPRKGTSCYTRQDSGEDVQMAVLGEILWPPREESDRSRKIVSETLESLAAEGALTSSAS